MDQLEELYKAIVAGDMSKAIAMTQTAVEQNVEPTLIINDYMSKGMETIGRQFEAGEVFVPELLMAARAMKGALDILKPLMAKSERASSLGKVLIGTVKGDLHDIGKNLVASMLEGCGFEVVNLGTDVSSEKFVNAIKEHHANIVCLSALLTTTMPYMQEVITAIDKAGLRQEVKIMVGGAPVNEQFADAIGADGFSSNANAAVGLARHLVEA